MTLPSFEIPGVRRLESNRWIYLMSDGESIYSIVEWYVGMGPTSTFFTLWKQVITPHYPYGRGNEPRFIQNLAQEQDNAIAKARELTGLDLSEEVYDIGRNGNKIERHARIAKIFHFGRYRGTNIAELYHSGSEGREYVTFMARSNWSPTDIAARNNLDYIQARYGEAAAEEGYWQLSEAWVRKQQEELKLAARKTLPFDGERVTIRSRSSASKTVESEQWGPSTKVLLEHQDGWKLFGSVPCDCEQGDIIQFTARIQKSDRDEFFGFYSGPTKASQITTKLVEVK